MAAVFFYVSRHPNVYDRVTAEVRSKFASVDDIRMGPELHSCVILKAAINEAMRLCPVAPQPLWRRTEEGGCVIDGEYIPAGLNVGASIYALHHNEEAFPNSFDFDIERWLVHASNEKEEAKEQDRIKEMNKSFAPFSVGPRQCIAKNFAQMELLLALAHVFWRLEFKKADGELGKIGEGGPGKGRGREQVGEFQFKSYFTSRLHGPMIQFKKREI
jgi:cytochrome P450